MIGVLRRHHRFMVGYTKAFLISLRRPLIFYLVVVAFSAIGIGAALFWFLECGANPHVDTYLDALYFTTATMTTVGYGDITPVTTFGRILAMCFMLFGTVLFVSFTAVLSSSILEIELRSDRLHKKR